MNIELQEKERELVVELRNEDYSLAEIIHHELLEQKNVTLAGVIPSHPLVPRHVIKLRTQRVRPVKVFQDSVDSAIQKVEEIKKLFSEQVSDKK